MADGGDESSAAAEPDVEEREPDDLDDEDFEDDEDYDEDEVSLGFVKPVDDPTLLLRNHFPSKMGGQPAWLDPLQLPLESDELKCKVTGEKMQFLLQLYAPLDESEDTRAFHRMLYVFISPRGSRHAEPGAVRAFRCQLPRYVFHTLLIHSLHRDRAHPARRHTCSTLVCPGK